MWYRAIIVVLGLGCLTVSVAVAGDVRENGGPGHRADKAALSGKTLTASDGAAGDGFGRAVAASGGTLLVGAPYTADTGQAYVFIKVSLLGTPTWTQLRILAPAELDAGDFFGGAVTISGDTAVVGAPYSQPAGAAYVFDRHQGGTNQWGQVAKLVADDAGPGDCFGWSVAISGDTAVAGAWGNDGWLGCAYIFERNHGGSNQWGQVTKLTASDGWAGMVFGHFVAIDGDTVAVSTSSMTTMTSGEVYVYQRDWGGVGNWGEVTKLVPSDGADDDRFGYSVALHDDWLLAGSLQHDGGAYNGGAVYLFVRDWGGANQWGEVIKIMPSDLESDDGFGSSVAISSDGERLVVGAQGASEPELAAGAAYLFALGTSLQDWAEVFKLSLPDAAVYDCFGESVAIDNDTVLIGAPYTDELGDEAGSAHVYEGLLFANDFEGGDTSLWSSATP